MSWREFERLSPSELAWRLWGERRRRTRMLRQLAWAVSYVMSPNVQSSDQSKITPARLFMAVTGGDLDDDEVS
jgi:hypothetical protein